MGDVTGGEMGRRAGGWEVERLMGGGGSEEGREGLLGGAVSPAVIIVLVFSVETKTWKRKVNQIQIYLIIKAITYELNIEGFEAIN